MPDTKVVFFRLTSRESLSTSSWRLKLLVLMYFSVLVQGENFVFEFEGGGSGSGKDGTRIHMMMS